MAKILEYTPPKPFFTRPELLLHPNIPKPLHGTNPRTILGKNWWDEKRKEAYSKNLYCCWACGVHKSSAKFHQWLEGHESYEIDYSLGRVKLLEIVALCHSCHNYIHDGRMTMLVKKGEMDVVKFNKIITHGNSLVKDLKPLKHNDKHPAQWNEWHLEINGEKHYGQFRSEAEWSKHYGGIPSISLPYEDDQENSLFFHDIENF